MKKFVCLLLGLCMCVAICAEVKCEEADSTLFVNYLRYVSHLGHAPSLSETGLFFPEFAKIVPGNCCRIYAKYDTIVKMERIHSLETTGSGG